MLEALLVVMIMAGAADGPIPPECPVPLDSPQWPRSDPRTPEDFDWVLFCQCDPDHEFCDD